MEFAIFGTGGVGAYLGARLADAGHDGHLVARADHLAAPRSGGLRVESVPGDTTVDLPATDDPAEVGPCDHVLFTVKADDTRSAGGNLSPLLGDDTAVVPVQNGVDNERWLAETVGDDHVAGGGLHLLDHRGTGDGRTHRRAGPVRVRRTRRRADGAHRGARRRAVRVRGGGDGAR